MSKHRRQNIRNNIIVFSSENHMNYYDFMYETRNIDEISEILAMEHINNFLRTHSKWQQRQLSCCDLASEAIQCVRESFSEGPKTESTTPRSVRTESFSSEFKSSLERRRNSRQIQEDASTSQTKQTDDNSKRRKKLLKKRSKSLNSFPLEKSSSKQNKNYCKKKEKDWFKRLFVRKEQNENGSSTKLINNNRKKENFSKLKSLFSSLKKPNINNKSDTNSTDSSNQKYSKTTKSKSSHDSQDIISEGTELKQTFFTTKFNKKDKYLCSTSALGKFDCTDVEDGSDSLKNPKYIKNGTRKRDDKKIRKLIYINEGYRDSPTPPVAPDHGEENSRRDFNKNTSGLTFKKDFKYSTNEEINLIKLRRTRVESSDRRCNHNFSESPERESRLTLLKQTAEKLESHIAAIKEQLEQTKTQVNGSCSVGDSQTIQSSANKGRKYNIPPINFDDSSLLDLNEINSVNLPSLGSSPQAPQLSPACTDTEQSKTSHFIVVQPQIHWQPEKPEQSHQTESSQIGQAQKKQIEKVQKQTDNYDEIKPFDTENVISEQPGQHRRLSLAIEHKSEPVVTERRRLSVQEERCKVNLKSQEADEPKYQQKLRESSVSEHDLHLKLLEINSKTPDAPCEPFWRREYSHHYQLHLDSSPEKVVSTGDPFSQVPTTISEVHNTDFDHEYKRRYSMGKMGSLDDHERKIIIEFCHLLEKSKQLFNGLRELPQYGHKQWHSYFGRTFDVYTKLWKFQQQHRAVLDSKYGLKRWQIGEIASKIGQLYYHFYLRTSETAYLNEAYSFYFAIRGRSYYTKASKEDKCELMVKKLRYYARFIVVCLLLKKVKLVRDLIKELDRQIIEYGNTYDPDDQIEWTVVVDEVKAFIQAEPVITVLHPESYPITLSHRLSQVTTPPIEKTSQMNLTLQEVLIVGSSSQQVKFSELTMDMFRMLQTLEREPTGDIPHMYDDSPRQRFNLTPSALNNKGYNLETGAPRCENPHKYLLFKPSPSQILVYLASGCNDLPPNGALLLYISADGQIVPPSKHPDDVGYDMGGLITSSKNELYRDSGKDTKGAQLKSKELQCLYPGDLYPFTRRPLFVIIDSDNSYVFQNIPRHFGQPLVILMSPLEVPASIHVTTPDRRQQGSLFTLFLHSPLTAFCHICDVDNFPLGIWERGQSYIDTFMTEAAQIITRSRIDIMFLNFIGDDFLRLLVMRYIFCDLMLRMHRSFRARTQLPRSSPAIPEELIEHPALIHIIMDLASHLQVRSQFQDLSAPGPPMKD